MIKIIFLLLLISSISFANKEEVINSILQDRARLGSEELYLYTCKNSHEWGNKNDKTCPECESPIVDINIDVGTLWYLIPHNLNEDGECIDEDCPFEEILKELESKIKK